MKTTTWSARILLTAAAAMTGIAGYRYACYPERDSAVEAAYYLGMSAKAGNIDARARLEHLFPDDAKAQIAYEHGLQSPTSPALGAGEVETGEPRVVRHPRVHHHSTTLPLSHHTDAAQPAASSAPVARETGEGDGVAHPVPQPGAAPDSAESDRSLT